MIDVTQTYKDNLHGAKTWEIQVSAEGSTWNDITWQDCPVGAEIVKPLGSIQQMTEDPQPFRFVGPDMQLMARNTLGFWTSDVQTGRLDTGDTVYVRVRVSSTAGEYITLIQGPIDSATFQKEPGDMVSFTVRGTLNALDYQLATEYCANRQFAKTGWLNGTYTVTGGAPVKFCDMLTIWPASNSGPDGCFKLFYDAKKKTISYDNGPARGILDMDGASFLISGETTSQGVAAVYVLWGSMGTRTFTALPSEDIETWIVQRHVVDAASGTDICYLYDCSPVSSLANFKAKLTAAVDLDISTIPNLAIDTPEPSIYQHVNDDGSDFYPAAIVGIGERTWLMSSWAGAYKGIWKVMISDDPMEIISFSKISDSVACYMKLIGTDVVCLCDTSTNKDEFTYKSFLVDGSLGVSVIALATMTETTRVPFAGFYEVAWKSFDALSATVAYCVIVTSGNNAQIYAIDIPGESASPVGSAFGASGPSMCPGCLVTNPSESYYVCITASYDFDGSLKYASRGWHIGTSVYSAVILDINYDREEVIGPVGIASAYTETEVSGSVENPSGVIVLFDKLAYSDVDYKATKHTAAGGDVWVINYSTGDTTFVYGAVGAFPTIPNTSKNWFYCAPIWEDQTGKTLAFTSGSNAGESKVISAHTLQNITPPGGSSMFVTKIAFGSDFTNVIANGDQFKIYETGVTLGDVVSTKIDELNGTTYLHNEIARVDDAYYEPSSYMVYNNTYRRRDVVGNEWRPSAIANFIRHTGTDSFGRKHSLGGIIYPVYGMVPHAFKKNLTGSMLAQVASSDRPWGAGKDTDGRAMIAGRYMLTFINTGGTTQKRQVSANQFENKTVREAIEEVATACNAYLFPSEHNRKLTLQYRGTMPTAVGGITRGQYQYDGLWSPRLPVDLLTIDGERRGNTVADKFGQELSLSSPQTHPSNRKSIANDIWEFLSQSRRWHKVITDWLIWHEPGDVVNLAVSSDTAKECLIVSTETDPESLAHSMTLLEEA